MSALKGKRVLVTGGNRGIGAGIARSLAKDGAQVAITYTSRSNAAEAVLKSLDGNGHISVKMNIADEESVLEGLSDVSKAFDRLDGAVNNAGIVQDQLLLRMKAEDFDSVVQTNLRGSFLVTKGVLKGMLKARQGSIVNITSVIGHLGNPGQSNYAASKAGIEGFARSVAKEVASRGVRINCVAPGFIVSDMTDSLDDRQRENILKTIPLNRLGQIEDVAKSVMFLLSDHSSYITGQTIHVNGGMYM